MNNKMRVLAGFMKDPAFFVFREPVKWACIKSGAGAVSGAVWCGFLTDAWVGEVPSPVIMKIKKTA